MYNEPYIKIHDYNINTRHSKVIDISVILNDTTEYRSMTVDENYFVYVATTNGLYRTTEPVVTTTPQISSPEENNLITTYPNPVRMGSMATISYSIEYQEYVTIVVRDLLGRKVTFKEVGQTQKGKNTVNITTDGLYPGLYVYTVIPSRGKPLGGKFVVAP
jgi:hypothetical protein